MQNLRHSCLIDDTAQARAWQPDAAGVPSVVRFQRDCKNSMFGLMVWGQRAPDRMRGVALSAAEVCVAVLSSVSCGLPYKTQLTGKLACAQNIRTQQRPTLADFALCKHTTLLPGMPRWCVKCSEELESVFAVQALPSQRGVCPCHRETQLVLLQLCTSMQKRHCCAHVDFQRRVLMC